MRREECKKEYEGWNKKVINKDIPLSYAESTGLIYDLYKNKLLPTENPQNGIISGYSNNKKYITADIREDDNEGEKADEMIKKVKELDEDLKNYAIERKNYSKIEYNKWLDNKNKISLFLSYLNKIDNSFWTNSLIQGSNIYLLGMALHSLSPQLKNIWIDKILNQEKYELLGCCMVKRGSNEIITENKLKNKLDRGDCIRIDNDYYCIDYKFPREEYQIIISEPYIGRSSTKIPIYKVNILDESYYNKLWEHFYSYLYIDYEDLNDIERIRKYYYFENTRLEKLKIKGISNNNYKICKNNVDESKKVLKTIGFKSQIFFSDLNDEQLQVELLDDKGKLTNEFVPLRLKIGDCVFFEDNECWYEIENISISKCQVLLVPADIISLGGGNLKWKIVESENEKSKWKNRILYFYQLAGHVILMDGDIEYKQFFIMPYEDNKWTYK